MRSRYIAFVSILIVFLLQSCLFGAGLVEEEITDGYWLFANNGYEEMSIWKDNRLIVERAVFAFGHNSDFIIALSHPVNSENEMDSDVTMYHIIDLSKSPDFNGQHNVGLTYDQFNYKFKELDIDRGIEYTFVFVNIE